MANGVAEFRPVQRVEMEMPDAACIEPAAEFGGNRRCDKLAGSRKFVQPFEQPRQPERHMCAAHRRHALDGCEIGDRHDARGQFRVDPCGCGPVLEAEEGFRFEKELRDGATGTRVELAFQIVAAVCALCMR